MNKNFIVWIILFIIAVLAVLAVKYYSYFPGDVAVEKWVQSLFPQSLNWAVLISRTAEFPWVLILLVIVFVLSWIFATWRAALVFLLSFGGMLLLGYLLGPVVARPRPSQALVHVIHQFPGYSFPSIFALRYAATIGFLAVLFAYKEAGALQVLILIVCSIIFVIGWFARISLASHWPSDVIISYYLGLLWATFLIRFSPVILGSFKV
jgi:membrane-associated phospholipid phosphatase